VESRSAEETSAPPLGHTLKSYSSGRESWWHLSHSLFRASGWASARVCFVIGGTRCMRTRTLRHTS
jgi:hypothetical protein